MHECVQCSYENNINVNVTRLHTILIVLVRRSTQNPYKKLKQTAIQLMQLGILYIYEASHGLLKTLIEQTKTSIYIACFHTC